MRRWRAAAIDFVDGLGVGEVDLLGFSIVSFVAQEIALVRPAIVRKVVLAASAPEGASGMHGWAADVIGAIGKPETSGEEYLSVGQPNHSLLQWVSAIDNPAFVANGDSDRMMLPRYSNLLAGLIPEVRLKIYPDAAHGFLFQHHAADVDAFLAGVSEMGMRENSADLFDTAGGLARWRNRCLPFASNCP